jgi:hypothetical protein
MTKKHYIAIAAEFQSALLNAKAEDARDNGKDALDNNRTRGVVSAISGFCRVAIADNARFNVDQFRAACGL